MARLDDAELIDVGASAGVGAGTPWLVTRFRQRSWGTEMVVHDDMSGGTHLLPVGAGRLLLALQAGQAVPIGRGEPSDPMREHLAMLERSGLIRRETPAA